MDRNGTSQVEAVSHRRTGPIPYSRFLDHDENAAARALLAELKPGAQYPGVVQVSHGAGAFVGFTFLEVRHPKRGDCHLVVGLPHADHTGVDAMPSAFSFVVSMTRPSMTPFKATKKTPLPTLARNARYALETLLDGIGWPGDDMALHRGVDRCLELEEKGIDASR